MEYIFIFLMLFNFKAVAKKPSELIVWNVGQGLWSTLVEDTKCFHFDAGGEFFNANRIRYACENKKNYLYLSHWDWDHIRFVSKLKELVSNICIEAPPEGRSEEYKEKMVQEIPRCHEWQKEVEQVQFPHTSDTIDGEDFRDTKKHHRHYKSGSKKLAGSKTNELSNIFVAQNKFLLPGDSTSQMEKIWAPFIKNKNIKTLVLAHHGSKTSTSEEFLENVPHATLAIASARKKKYGHPHQVTVDRLHVHGIPILTTEDWGNIHVEE